MFKTLIITTVAAAPFFLTAEAAKAQRGGNGGVYSGTCPSGTCAKGGSSRANDVRNCKASNCRGGQQPINR